jgi:hypothetical protein
MVPASCQPLCLVLPDAGTCWGCLSAIDFCGQTIWFTTLLDIAVYHPNIDAQGRICLDFLNMPPKVLAVLRSLHGTSAPLHAATSALALSVSEPCHPVITCDAQLEAS